MTDFTPLELAAQGQADESGAVQGAWLDQYFDLQASGLHWKKAAYAAWYSAPKNTRQPRTLDDLAALLGYASPQVFHKWRHQAWWRERGIDRLREGVLLNHLADVDRATILAALHENGAAGVQARRLFYEQLQFSWAGAEADQATRRWLIELTRLQNEPLAESETENENL